jgi:hypothetical protein
MMPQVCRFIKVIHFVTALPQQRFQLLINITRINYNKYCFNIVSIS